VSQAPDKLPDGILVSFYGDDFTGAAATLEVLAFAGLKSILFLDPPTQSQLDRFSDLQAVGVASTARAQSPEWMGRNLPGVFESLSRLNPALVHYKICSTLDSSPEIGSIGRAVEIAADLYDQKLVPLLVAAPQMRRYQSFGTLFAAHGNEVYRLDRHPVMARHPVTPITEADVGRHIQKQSMRVESAPITLEALASGSAQLKPVSDASKIVIAPIDSCDEASEAAAGKLIWNSRETARFVVGSQGVEYALVRHWTEVGLLPKAAPPPPIDRVSVMPVVSGSVSPTTAEQIAWARQNGFSAIAFDAIAACGDDADLQSEESRIVGQALAAISSGQSPLIHTAEGPDDEAVITFRRALSGGNLDLPKANQRLGEALGRVLQRIIEMTGLRRAVVSGGDTSGYTTRQLGIFALSALAPTIPGASISRAHGDGAMDGLELALKGGQMGTQDYFGWIRDGGGKR
jgi:uncharacterized protein YgbK (DUF1537 family)